MIRKKFFIKYWKLLSVLVILSVMTAYHFIKLEVVRKAHNNMVEKIKADHDLLLESNKTAYYTSLTEILSWVVKSEIIRNNNENAYSYLQNVVKSKFLVLQADLIDPISGNVNFSTNPTFINTTIKLVKYDEVKKMDDDFYYIPVIGENDILAILRIKFEY